MHHSYHSPSNFSTIQDDSPQPFLQQLSLNFSHTMSTSDSSDLQLYPCYQGTFVLINLNSISHDKKYATVRHVDCRGQTIKEIDLGFVSYAKLHMMTQQHVIVETFFSDEKIYSIAQWDLGTGEIFKCSWSSQWYNQVMLFSETSLICVIERSNHNCSYLSSNSQLITKISYFQFPLTKNQQQPAHVFMPQETECLTYYDQARKINNHSGICWIKINDFDSDRCQDYLTFFVLDLRKQPAKIQSYKLDDSFNKKKDLFSAGIFDVWEIKKDELYIKCRVELSLQKFRKQKISKQHKIVEKLLSEKRIHQFIYSLQQGKSYIPKFVKNSEGSLSEHAVQFTNGLRPIKRIIPYNLRAHEFTQSVRPWIPQQYQPLSVLYLSADTLQVIHTEFPLSSDLTTSNYGQSQFPDSDHFCYMEYTLHRKDWRSCEQECRIQVKLTKMRRLVFDAGVICCFLLEETVEKCDEDLLSGVVQMLEDGQVGSGIRLQDFKQSQ